VVAGAGIGPRPHLLGVGALIIVVGVLATRALLPADADVRTTGPAFARPSRGLAALGAIAFCALLAEGAMGDWSALYLHGSLGTSAGLAAAGYAAFSLAMAGGRMVGDRLASRIGPTQLLRLGGAVVALGLGAGLVAGDVPAALLGFACTGAGLSAVFPIALSLAGRRATAAGPAIAAVSSLGYLGFLAGPPLIGFVAGASSLRLALAAVVLLGGLIAVLPSTLAEGR
jgi:fucose permease